MNTEIVPVFERKTHIWQLMTGTLNYFAKLSASFDVFLCIFNNRISVTVVIQYQ